jgi:hypothetical protein
MQRSRSLLGQFFREKVTGLDGMATNVVCPGLPQSQWSSRFRVPAVEWPSAAPEYEDRTSDAPAGFAIRLVILAIECGSSPVLLADGMDACRIAQSPDVGFSYITTECFGRRAPAAKRIIDDRVRSALGATHPPPDCAPASVAGVLASGVVCRLYGSWVKPSPPRGVTT